MRFITKSNWKVMLAVLAVGALAVGTVSSVTSQCCGRGEPAPEPVVQPIVVQRPVYIPAPVVVQRPAPVIVQRPAPAVVSSGCTVCRPAFKTVAETQMREEQVTTYETVWEEETRYRTRTVCRQVPETSVRQETYTVSKPVWETVEKETSYDVVKYVPETSEREEVQLVNRPVTEYQERQIVETVNRPVTETVMQERSYTVQRPVTTCQTQLKDVGQYTTQYTPQPGRDYTRLTWQRGGDYYDPATGTTKYRLPGLYWTDMKTQTTYKPQQVYQPAYVAQQVQVTSYVPETVTEQVPVTVNKVIQEQVCRTEKVPITRMIQEQIVKKIPVTSYKPVTERVVQKTPVRVCRMETEQQVREIPVTTYKTVTENIQEPYTVRIAKQVPKTVTVQRPVTVYKQVPIDPCPVISSPCEASPCGTSPCATGACGVNTSAAPATLPAPAAATTPAPAANGQNAADSAPGITPEASSTEVRYPGPVNVDPTVYSTEPAASADKPAVPFNLENKSGEAADSRPQLEAPAASNQTEPAADASTAPAMNQPAADSSNIKNPTAPQKGAAAGSAIDITVEKPIPPAPPITSEQAVPKEEQKTDDKNFTFYSPTSSIQEVVQIPVPQIAPTQLLKNY